MRADTKSDRLPSVPSFLKGVFVGAGIIIGLLVLLFFAMPYIYLHTENRNFVNLQEKSELNCETMPLHCLVRDEDMEEIAKYCESGNNIELKDNWGRTALFWAIANGKHNIVNYLLSAKSDPNTIDEAGISVFFQTVAWGEYNVGTQLLASGANIDALNGSRYPETALHFCVMKDKPECVRYLLEHGANKYLEDSFGYTVFERIKTHNHS